MSPVTCAAFAALKAVTASLVITGACPAYMSVTRATPGIVLDFSQAKAARLDVSASGVTIQGFRSAGAPYSGLNCRNASNVTFIDAKIVGPGVAGVTATECDHITISASWVTGSKGDGFDFAGSSYVTIKGGGCLANVPTAIHADCVQGWAYNGKSASHFYIASMTINGPTQGIDNFGDSTGDSDWRVIGNKVATTFANGIALVDATQIVVEGNILTTLPGGSTGPTQIRVLCGATRTPCPDAVVSGNVAGEAP